MRIGPIIFDAHTIETSPNSSETFNICGYRCAISRPWFNLKIYTVISLNLGLGRSLQVHGLPHSHVHCVDIWRMKMHHTRLTHEQAAMSKRRKSMNRMRSRLEGRLTRQKAILSSCQ
jgi:hypothetical protein